MTALNLLLLCLIAGPLSLLSTGCTTNGRRGSNVRLLRPGTTTTTGLRREDEQDFYQPPRDPQFNTARDN
jgi:hypothetical protein